MCFLPAGSASDNSSLCAHKTPNFSAAALAPSRLGRRPLHSLHARAQTQSGSHHGEYCSRSLVKQRVSAHHIAPKIRCKKQSCTSQLAARAERKQQELLCIITLADGAWWSRRKFYHIALRRGGENWVAK